VKTLTKCLFIFLAALALNTNQLKAEPGEFHFGIDGGFTYADMKAEETAQEIANLSGSTVTYTYDEATWAGRIYGGYGVADNMDLEVGFWLTGSLDATYTIGANSASESYDMSAFDVSLKYDVAGTPFFAKGGVHQSTLNGAATITIGGNEYDIADSITGTGWLIGGGMEIDNSRYGLTYIANVGGDSDSSTAFAYYGMKF
jgi:hypothetical protein